VLSYAGLIIQVFFATAMTCGALTAQFEAVGRSGSVRVG
jgi:hypothetical protein